ncbi:MAG: MarR family transcriptional regulator [Undibacterium sp.]|nr:MarR family transcriptional regulator [Opitutaceae bacterium]
MKTPPPASVPRPVSSLELIAAVMATADTFMRESQRLFRPHGLTGAPYNVLTILAHEPAGISQRELGDRLVVDRSNVTGLLDRLEKNAWARRGDHPEDRRVYRVSLTPAGRALWQKITPLYLEAAAQITRELPAKRMREGLDILRRLEAGAVAWKLVKN